MPYDPNLDNKIYSETREFEGTRITVGIFSYNEGEKKMQLSRENNTQGDEWRYAKLGRLNKREAETIVPLMQEALSHME